MPLLDVRLGSIRGKSRAHGASRPPSWPLPPQISIWWPKGINGVGLTLHRLFGELRWRDGHGGQSVLLGKDTLVPLVQVGLAIWST